MTAIDAPPILRLRLPGSWWDVPLDDRDVARASIRKLVRTQVGTADAQAAGRIELERRMLAGLDTAIAGDGVTFHVALVVVPGAKLSLNAMVASPDEVVPNQPDPSLTAVDILQAVVERGRDEQDPPLARIRSRAGTAIRRIRHHEQVSKNPPSGEEPRRVRHAAFEYWFAAPETRRLVVATFSVPAGPLEAELLQLCDSIVAVSDWGRPALLALDRFAL